jgi:YrbI family 3-deoxy-D-manno-octulosonate 8-phosphate phosphatase
LTDIDGVLTDGRVTIDVHGNETKSICYRDLDAIGIGRRAGYDFAFVTGEDTPMVDVLAKRFGVTMVFRGAKDKLAALGKIAAEFDAAPGELLYIGDSDRDAPAMEAAGLGVAPRDGAEKAINAADYVTRTIGGSGVLHEVVSKLISAEWTYPGKA